MTNKKEITTKSKAKKTDKTPTMEDIVEILRKLIVEQELPPGSKLKESVLTEEFKVSRPRIREAFGILEDRGLIQRIPNKGAVVTRIETDEIYSLFQVREVLEGLAVRLATEKGDSSCWEKLFESFGSQVQEAINEGNLDSYLERVEEFRKATISAAQNPILSDQLTALYDRTKILIRRLVLVPGRANVGLKQHQEILKAMIAGNAELAEQLKRQNIRSSKESFSQYKKYLL